MTLIIFGKRLKNEGKQIQKTPPDGEKGGEKQYKDYEKNPNSGLPSPFIVL